MPTFLGLRGTGDWVANQRPESWRETVLRLFPNGQAPLTAMLAMLPSEPVSDPKFHWWTKSLPLQSGVIAELYTNSLLSAVYASGAVAGTVLYAKVAQAVAEEFRIGHTAMFRKLNDYRHDTRGKVTQVVLSGANSFIAISLHAAANATFDLDEATHIMVIGNVNAEGATMPDVIAYDPVQFTNVTQIFRTPLSITRTAMQTRLRTGDQYQESKREALELHSIEQEKGFIWGKMFEGVGANGKPERATNGLVDAVITNSPANVSAYHLDTNYSAQTWENGGKDWLNTQLEVIWRVGRPDKLGLCGNQVALGLQILAEQNASINLTPVTVEYGIRVMKWEHQFGTLFFKTHPLFNHDPITRSDMLVFEPQNLRLRTIQETEFIEDPMDRRNRNHSKDGRDEEFLTEVGLEYHHTDTMGYLSGFNLDNIV